MSSVETQKLDMQQIKQTALQKAKEQGLNYPSYEELKNKIKEIDISTHNGNFKLSKEDVLDFAKLHPEVHNIFSSFTVDDQQKRDRDQAKERLTLKYGNNFKELEDRLYGIASLTDGLLPMTDISLNVHREVKSAARLLSNINYTKVAEIEVVVPVSVVSPEPSKIDISTPPPAPKKPVARKTNEVAKKDEKKEGQP